MRADSQAIERQSDKDGWYDESGEGESNQICQEEMSGKCPEIYVCEGCCGDLTGYGHSTGIPDFPDASCERAVIIYAAGPE